MSTDVALTFGILAASIALFVSDRLRLDVVAMMALLALALTGVLAPNEAIAGFSNPAVLMIAGLFVIGAALTETGVADWLGQRLGRVAGKTEGQLVAVVMLATACLSAFMSSTGTVAILLPVVGTLALRRGIPLPRVLMPLAFAAHLGSMLTLISTPPNLLVSDALREAGREPFRFFSFFPPGVVLLGVGVGFFVLFGRRSLPGAGTAVAPAGRAWTPADFASEYGIAGSLHALRVPPGSKLCGQMLGETDLRTEHHVNVIGISGLGQGGLVPRPVLPRTVFAPGDQLRVQGEPEAVDAAAAAWGLERLQAQPTLELPPEESLAEVVLPRRSTLAGRTLREARFRDRYRATVLAVRRGPGHVVVPATPALADYTLQTGDTLLVKGRRKYLRNLRDERRDLILVAEPDAPEDVLVDPVRAGLALSITFAMLVVMAFGWLPNVVAVLLAAVGVVLARCVRPVDAYRAVNWESLVLIAGMLPLATALDQSGGTRLLVDQLERHFEGASATLVMAGLVALTSALGMVISNTATAVLVAPVAVRVAEALSIAPEPLLMGVAIAASAAFATPIASPVNTIVIGPGGYRFGDFVRVGLPLQLLILATAVVVVPIFFPF